MVRASEPWSRAPPPLPFRLCLAGVVSEQSDGVTGPAFITIILPRPGDVVTVQVATGIDAGDGGVLTSAQDHLADGGVFDKATDQFYVLFDEDNANNPYGTSALSASVGLVDAVYVGVNG